MGLLVRICMPSILLHCLRTHMVADAGVTNAAVMMEAAHLGSCEALRNLLYSRSLNPLPYYAFHEGRSQGLQLQHSKLPLKLNAFLHQIYIFPHPNILVSVLKPSTAPCFSLAMLYPTGLLYSFMDRVSIAG